MHPATLSLLFLTLTTSLCPAAERNTSQDLVPLQGTWQLVYGAKDGAAIPDQQLIASRLEINGDTFRFFDAATIAITHSGRFSVDTSVTPHTVDTIATSSATAVQGIWKFQGDVYTLVFSRPGGARPTEFTSNPGSGRLLQVWKRIDAAGSGAGEFPDLIGEWVGDHKVFLHETTVTSHQIFRITAQHDEC